MVPDDQCYFNTRMPAPPRSKLVPFFVDVAVKKITQKNNLLWCKLTDERIQYFKIFGVYLLRYGDAVTAKIP
jgi:hypothetical protein